LNHVETVHIASPEIIPSVHDIPTVTTSEAIELDDYVSNEVPNIPEVTHTAETAEDDRSLEEVKRDEQDEDLYSVKNFAL
jgi:hypothetical protein